MPGPPSPGFGAAGLVPPRPAAPRIDAASDFFASRDKERGHANPNRRDHRCRRTMGSGIAQVCAVAALNVVLTDVNDALVEKGVAAVDRNLDRLVAKSKLSAADKTAALARDELRRSGAGRYRDRNSNRES